MAFDRQLADVVSDLQGQKFSAEELVAAYQDEVKKRDGAKAIVPDLGFQVKLGLALAWLVQQKFLSETFDKNKNTFVYSKLGADTSKLTGSVRDF